MRVEQEGRPEMELRDALKAANLPALLMVLYQLTGESRWLEPPYRPTRTKGMSDHDSGGFTEGVQRDIRAAALEAINAWQSGTPAAVPTPRGRLLVDMMSSCMGEPVTEEFEPMMAQEMGFAPRCSHPVTDDNAAARGAFTVVVIGAGVSGLLAAATLRGAGIEVTVLEQSAEVGGTWLDNRYPGAGVDTPSYLYSFSFFERDWSTHFGKRDEVLAYLGDVAKELDLLGAIRFRTKVTGATYDETAQRWTVSATGPDGEPIEYVANAVVTAVGQLNRPKLPEIPGLSSFAGPVFHSARWPEGLDVSGKRVAVIGSGASAMQIVPAIAKVVDRLTVFQRSPQWIAPNSNYFRPVDDAVHYLMSEVPYYKGWYRFRLAWTFNDKTHAALQIDPDWPHQDRSVNAINDGHRAFFTKYLRKSLAGREDLIEKALPTYPPFGKRMLLDNGWFEALRRDNVELVTDPVAEVTPTGVRTAVGADYDVDVIVLATGFEAQRALYPLDIVGRDGRTIRQQWGDDDARAYLGITTPGFPNLFFMYGPNTNLGHGGSYIFIAECQITYITDLICAMTDQGIGSVECRPDVNEEYNNRVDEAHARMIWSHPGMHTWYRNRNGRVVTNSPWRVVDYWQMTQHADLDDFIRTSVGPPPAPTGASTSQPQH